MKWAGPFQPTAFTNMRSALEQRLNDIWYGQRPVPPWLALLEPLYGLACRMHRTVQGLRPAQDLRHQPIVVVGNLTAGGSGKTPFVIRLCQLLRERGLKAGVVSRGYGRRSRGLFRVQEHSRPADAGDEPVLIAHRTGAEVVVCADRSRAARDLFARGADVVIADDGLQHHRLPRQMEICVVDGQRGFGNGRLLPAGPLREPLARLQQVDYVVVNDADGAVPAIRGHQVMQLAPGWLRTLEGGGQAWRLAQFSGCRVNAVAGIGNPQRFFTALEHAGLKPIPHAFGDHHAYTLADFAAMEAGLPIIMTEKDAVKCAGMKLANAWYLSVDAVLPAAFEQELCTRILALALRRDRA